MPGGWAWCRLGEIVEVSSAKRVLQQDWKKSGIPFYRAREIAQLSNNEKVIDDLFITSQLYSELKLKYGVPIAGDLMVSAVGTIGKIYIVKDTDCFYYKDASVICFSKKGKNIDSLYLKFCCESDFLQEQMYSQSKGTTVDTITINKAQNYLIPLPPISEQKKIVDSIQKFFSHIDILEHNKSELKISIKQAKSKILDLAIHGKLVPQDPNDESAEELLKRIATSDNRPYEKVGEEPFEIPHSWKWVRLGSVCDYGKCINVSTSDLRANDWILDLEDIEKDSGKILAFHTLKERKSESTKHKFTKGQVLYSKLRPYLNKVVIAPKDGFCTSEILPLDFNEILLNRFAQIVLMSSYFLTLVNMVTYGVKMPRLGTGDAKNMLIPIPPLNEQKCIVSKIDELFSNLDQIQNNLI